MKNFITFLNLIFLCFSTINLAKAQTMPVPAPVFGENGHINFPMLNVANGASGGEAIMQADGKIVIGGTAYPNSPWPLTCLIRFDPTCGKIDSTFGQNGIVINPIEAVATINSMVVQADGKIVGGGDVNAGFDTNGFPALFRYNSDGSIDLTYNGTGYIKDNFRGGIGRISKILKTSDDKILAIVKGGSLFNMGCGVLKYKTNGERDSLFGVNGFADIVYDYAPSQSGQGACMLADSSILIANLVGTGPFGTRHLSLAKITKDGFRDSTFNENGYREYLEIDFDLQGNYRVKLKEFNDGRILMSYGINAPSQSIVKMLAFLPNGDIDNTFADDGMFTYGTNARPGDFIIDDENRILNFIGNHSNDGPGAVLRLLPNGTFDSSFGNNGIINFMHTPFPNVDYRKFNGGFILPNGDILAYGDWAQGFIASRFTFNPEIDGIPQITQSGNDLTTIGLGEFQWYLNDIAIDGATSNSHTPTADGIYTVSMGFDDCTFTSEPFEIITTSIQTTNYSNIKIRNNPTSDFIFFDNAPSNMIWEIFNIEGKRLLSGNQLADAKIDMREFETGVYILRCGNMLQTATFKIIKQ